jgi:hypothetical protein
MAHILLFPQQQHFEQALYRRPQAHDEVIQLIDALRPLLIEPPLHAAFDAGEWMNDSTRLFLLIGRFRLRLVDLHESLKSDDQKSACSLAPLCYAALQEIDMLHVYVAALCDERLSARERHTVAQAVAHHATDLAARLECIRHALNQYCGPP